MNWHTCWLEELGGCGGPFHRHHLLNKSKFIGVKKTKAFKTSLNLLMVPVCASHNVGRTADTPASRKILLGKLRDEYGEDWCRWALDEVLSKTKVRKNYSDLEYDAIIGGVN